MWLDYTVSSYSLSEGLEMLWKNWRLQLKCFKRPVGLKEVCKCKQFADFGSKKWPDI